MFTARGGDQIWQCPSRPSAMDARSWKTSNNVEHAPNCPRCASSNTKFCYYNNYSLSQPRYFCKGCRRYWTKGGSLRNVPVGGGCRKNRRSRSAAATAAAASRIPQSERSFNSSNYNSNPNDPFGNSCSLIQENNNGSDIDLAVVFAKFLNQNPEFSGSELSNNEILTPDSSNPSSNVLGDADLLLQEVVGGKEQDGSDGDDMFGMQSLLGDQDVLWLDQGADLPSFSWESVEELREFEDPLKISANLMMTDNWSSFDLSGLEVFSRPQ